MARLATIRLFSRFFTGILDVDLDRLLHTFFFDLEPSPSKPLQQLDFQNILNNQMHFSRILALSTMGMMAVAAQNSAPDTTQQLQSTAGIPDNTNGE